MTVQTRPTHWHGVDSHEDWPRTGCPINWEWLESYEADGETVYQMLMGMAMSVMRMPEEGRPTDHTRYASYLACHGLAAMNYL